MKKKKSSEITRVGFHVKVWEFSCNNVTGKQHASRAAINEI